MEILIINISLKSIFFIGTFIVYELLKSLGFWNLVIESTYTHPKFNIAFFIIGDMLFAIGTGVVASVSYSYLAENTLHIKALVYGIISLIIGSIFKEYFKK